LNTINAIGCAGFIKLLNIICKTEIKYYNICMRRYGVIVIIILFSLNLAGCDMRSWRNYYDSEYKFSLRMPRSWDLDESAINAALVAYLPSDPSDDNFAGNIRVVADNLPAEIPLSAYYDINRAEFEQVFKKLIDLKEGQGMSGLTRYQWIAFNARIGEKTLIRAISSVWIKGKRVYVLTCVMNLRRAQEIEPIFRKVISSFRVH
jgi:hypothetical protein